MRFVTYSRLFYYATMFLCRLRRQQELACGQPPYIPALKDEALRRLG